MKRTFTFLGTGGSTGVPLLGCHCAVCCSTNPRNQRLRASGLLVWDGRNFLLDVGPDFRQQALNVSLDRIDGVLLTHPHYDHIAGIDELRSYFFHGREPLPCLLSDVTLSELKKRNDYLFRDPSELKTIVARLEFHPLPFARGESHFLDLPVRYFTYDQGGTPVNGFRFGPLAYVTDIHDFPETIFEDLDGVSQLIIGASRFTPSALHLSVDEAIDFSRRAKAKETWLIHMGHEIEYTKASSYLPKGLHVAYDGLTIEVS